MSDSLTQIEIASILGLSQAALDSTSDSLDDISDVADLPKGVTLDGVGDLLKLLRGEVRSPDPPTPRQIIFDTSDDPEFEHGETLADSFARIRRKPPQPVATEKTERIPFAGESWDTPMRKLLPVACLKGSEGERLGITHAEEVTVDGQPWKLWYNANGQVVSGADGPNGRPA